MTQYFHPTATERTQLSLRSLPPMVLSGERALVPVEVDGESFLWSINSRTWEQLHTVLLLTERELPVDIQAWWETTPYPQLRVEVL